MFTSTSWTACRAYWAQKPGSAAIEGAESAARPAQAAAKDKIVFIIGELSLENSNVPRRAEGWAATAYGLAASLAASGTVFVAEFPAVVNFS
jgi:hypothetical protein